MVSVVWLNRTFECTSLFILLTFLTCRCRSDNCKCRDFGKVSKKCFAHRSTMPIALVLHRQRTNARERKLVGFAREGLGLLCNRRNNDLRHVLFFVFFFHNETRRIIDLLNYNNQPEN